MEQSFKGRRTDDDDGKDNDNGNKMEEDGGGGWLSHHLFNAYFVPALLGSLSCLVPITSL